jgi:outer membrane biosynthesis protein TonB
MENNRTQTLQEIEAELAALKQQLLALEEKVAALHEAPARDLPADESDFTDMEFGVVDLAEETKPAPESLSEPEKVEEPELEPIVEPEPEPEVEPEPVVEPEPEPVVEPEPEPVVEPEPEVEPVPEPEIEPVPEPAEEAVEEPVPASKPAVAVVPGTERLPWRLDKPGLPVKNVRSGISLYDRALFIGTLFKEDYALYDKTIAELNGLAGLDEAVAYIVERFPDWDLKSGIVYNFIMAIRKKLG